MYCRCNNEFDWLMEMIKKGNCFTDWEDVAKSNMKRRDINLDRWQVSVNERSNYGEPYSLKSISLSSNG